MPNDNDIEAARRVLRELLDTPPGTMTREAFGKLTPSAKSEFCRKGGKLTDHATPSETPRLAILSRTEFGRLSAKDRSDYCRWGGLVREDNTPPPTPRATQPAPKKEGIAFSELE